MATKQIGTELCWQAPEFKHYHKTAGWYIALAAIGALVVTFFIVQDDTFAAITIGIICILALLFAKQKPEIIDIRLTSKGVYFGNLFLPYKQLKYFWIVNEEHHKTLNLHTVTYFNNIIILELEGQDPETIRDYLAEFLPEHEQTMPTPAQRIRHRLKF